MRKTDPERGERIKLVRTQILRMRSQEKMAAALTLAGKQTSRGAVGNWELGKEIGLDSLTAICKISGVDLNWLAYNDGAPPSTDESTTTNRALVSSFDPDAGDVMQGTGGCRKLRWAVKGKNKGKSGGVRTITLFSGESLPVFLITAFGKGQKVNLSKAERNSLKGLAEQIVQEYSRRVVPIAVGE